MSSWRGISLFRRVQYGSKFSYIASTTATHSNKIAVIVGQRLLCSYQALERHIVSKRVIRMTYLSRQKALTTMAGTGVITDTDIESPDRPRVYITRRIPESGLSTLQSVCEVRQWDSDDPVPRDELLAQIKGCSALYCLIGDKIDGAVLDAAGSGLKVIGTMSVGYDHIDLKECTRRGISVGFTPDVLTMATAELTVSLLLATARRLKEGMHAVVAGEWSSWKPMWLCGQGLHGSTVGIIGLGRIGSTVAHCLKPFGIERLLYCGSKPSPNANDLGAIFVSFSELLEQSDFVIVCCALTENTKGMLNVDSFKKMKRTSVLVNTSRGGVVNQDDLLLALQTGQIWAAGLDVTTPEPLPTNSPLLQLPNCVILPHIGSSTDKARKLMAGLTAANIIAGLSGEPLPSQIKS